MKKILVLTLCLSMIFVSVGCSSDKKAATATKETTETQTSEDNSKASNNPTQDINEKKETDSNNKKSTEASSNDKAVKDKANDSKKVNKVNSTVKLYEGTYFDDRNFGDNIVKDYCEIEISNITNTSFDFTIYQVNKTDDKKVDKKVIFLTNTAVFIEDGTKAAFYGNNYTLNFTFPNNHNAYPAVTDITVSGFQPLEGKTYVNNGVPGHEFG